ncbi:hypothetical protein CF319_g2026 [Tilletia indica]|nr:hypothetical protein CF319_g2026 [Tilletia indica]
MAASRIVKWPTHLSITTDLILGKARSVDNSHTVDSTLFDANETAADVTTLMWARVPPKEGAYLIVQAPMATKPIRFNVNDVENIRLIPEAFDGTNPENDHLPAAVPFLTGTGVVKKVSPDRRKCTLGGLVFLNKTMGYVEWEADASFDDTIKWLAWLFPPSGMLVSFDAILNSVSPDGGISVAIRRITTIQTAPQNLLTALSIGQGGSTDRAARIRQARAGAATQVNKPIEAADVFDNKNTKISEVTDEREADTPMKDTISRDLAPAAPKSTRNGVAMGPPSSPTPAPQTRKRRLE